MFLFRSNRPKQLVEANRETNVMLQKAKKEENRTVKLLLLGAGESGKSTIFKQMRILYNQKAITDEERQKFTSQVYESTIMGMKVMLRHAEEMDLKVEDTESAELITEIPERARVDPTIGTAIKSLWADPAIQKVFSRRAELQLPDSIRFFMDNIGRIMDINYLATPSDHLYVRVRTTGVICSRFELSGAKFEMYDVGGQRNERRKWIHCFDSVQAVIFVAALSEYDQVLFEDRHSNRMVEALDLFEEVCDMKYFKETAIILFLNKFDLFREKVPTTPLNKVVVREKRLGEMTEVHPWQDYTGGADVNAAKEYFKDQFLARNSLRSREIYYHVTTATDTGNMKFVFEACQDIILRKNIDESGL